MDCVSSMGDCERGGEFFFIEQNSMFEEKIKLYTHSTKQYKEQKYEYSRTSNFVMQ